MLANFCRQCFEVPCPARSRLHLPRALCSFGSRDRLGNVLTSTIRDCADQCSRSGVRDLDALTAIGSHKSAVDEVLKVLHMRSSVNENAKVDWWAFPSELGSRINRPQVGKKYCREREPVT